MINSMTMNEFLSLWLKDAASVCANENWSSRSDEECCILLGQTLLNVPEGSLTDVAQAVSETFDINISSDNLSLIVEYLLVFAVTESGDSRFVEAIMAFEVEAQVLLKRIIEDKLSSTEYEQEDDDGEHEDVEFMVEDVPLNQPMKIQVATAQDISVMDEIECRSCLERTTKVKALQQDLKQITKKFQEEILKLKEENSAVMNKNVDMEMQIMEKENALFEKEQSLRDFEIQKEKIEAIILRNSKLEEQVLLLQDEVDVLKPCAAKLDFAEAQADRFRARLDELNDIKQQLRVESDSHSETFQKLTELEQEVEGLRKLKPQLEEYRAQFAETSIVVQELQMRLESSTSALTQLQSENKALRGGQTENREQAQQLADELRITAEQLRERERMNGVGEGMSELNPALMQELNRLRTENKELCDKLDATALGALEGLRKDIAEQKCVNSSLQKKWMTTKDALEGAQRDIRTLTAGLAQKEWDLAEVRQQNLETAQMVSEDVDARRQLHIRQLQFHTKKHIDAINLTHLGHNAVVDIYAESLQVAHTDLEATQQEVMAMTALQMKTANDLAGAREEIQEAGHKRKFIETEHEQTLVQLQGEFDNTLEMHTKKHKVELGELEERMRREIAVEQQRTADLAAQVEQDHVRMRKLNNQKRVQEQEVARLKTQLRTAVSSDAVGEGVSEAMSELKAMEQQLKEANSEIAILRSRVATSSDGKTSTGQINSVLPTALGAPVRLGSASSGVTSSGEHMHATAGDASYGSLGYAGYLEQADYAEKRIKQLTDERRAMIAKGLEEMREKNELLQKLLAIEKDFNELKCEKRKIELENRRMDAKLDKILSAQQHGGTLSNKENILN